MRRYERGQHMVPPVPGAPVPVPPAVVGGQQLPQRGEQIVVAAGARLDERDPGGGMRHEHIEQPVPPGGHLPQKPPALPGEVAHLRAQPVTTSTTCER